MTDGLDQALTQVAFTLLAADPISPALVVLDGYAPSGQQPPYVLIYSTVDRPDSDLDLPFNGRSSVWVTRWICHCIALSASDARAIAQRVRTQLLDASPTVAGLSCGLIREEPAAPPQRDEEIGYPVFDLIATYRLRATS